MKQFFYRVIYAPVVNKFLRGINRGVVGLFPCAVKLPPAGLMTIRDGMNRPVKLHTNQTNYLTHLIYWEGGALNFEYTDIFVKLIRRVKGFYDIGANIGYYSLLAASENPTATIVGFEPASGPLHYFRKNVDANSFSQIRVEDIALSDIQGELTFFEIKNRKYTYLTHNLAGESNAGSKTSGKNFVPVQVKATTLDAYVSQHHDVVDLIKMDTEGTEHLILQQASQTIAAQKPIIICETLFNTIEAELDATMRAHGYLFFNNVPGGLQQVETLVRDTDNGVRNCFFVHPERMHLIADFIKEVN